MASTFSPNLSIELIGTGDQAGTWGTTTNSNLGTLIEQAISGYVTQAVVTGTDTTITIPNGSTGVARNMYIELTGTGGTNTNLIVPANKKLYFIFNNSTGAVTVKVSGQTGVSVPTGKKMVLVSNGTDIVNGLNYIADFASNSATITHLSATSASITNLTLTSLVISNLSIASANITTLTGSTQTLSGNLTLNGGTANGVLYLNGSKVATSGTALVFDGTNLGIGGSPSFYQGSGLLISRSGYATIRLNDSSGGGTAAEIKQSDSAGLILESISNRPIQFNVNASEQMRLTSTGLGIGTSSPGAKLDVTGTFNGTQAVFGNTSGRGLLIGTALNGGVNEGSSVLNSRGAGNGQFLFQTDGTTRMTLTDTGNLGLGVTPSAVSVGDRVVQVRNFLFNDNTNGYGILRYNNFFNGTNDVYLNTGAVSAFQMQGNAFKWYQAASGTAGNTITFTQAMTLDASGNLALGNTSASGMRLLVSGYSPELYDPTTASAKFAFLPKGSQEIFDISTGATLKAGYANLINISVNDNNGGDGIYYGAVAQSAGNSGSNFVFGRRTGATSWAESARITSGGDLLVAKTAASDSTLGVEIQAAGTVVSTRSGSTNSQSTLIVYSTGATAYRFYVGMDGTVNATNTTISAVSDQRLKENIQDLDVGLNKIMALKPRKFDWKAGKGKDIKGDRGWIAQEFEQVFPDMIDTWKDPAPEGEEPYKSVRADLIPVLVKAIQELTARVAQLESK
jgi:hypothetical protein